MYPNPQLVVGERYPQPVSRTSIGSARNPETTKAILESAAAMLVEGGYALFTVDGVAERANSSSATIYRHWRSKGALLKDVYTHACLAFTDAPDSGDLQRDLTDYLRALWHWWNRSRTGEILRSYLIEAQFDRKGITEFRDDFLPGQEFALQTIFAQAMRRGEIMPEAAVDQAVSALISMSLLHLMTASLRRFDHVEATVGLVVKGVTSPG